MVKIKSVEERSKAKRKGVKPGDSLVSINGNEICDVLDYRFYLAERRIVLKLVGEKGEYSVKIKKANMTTSGLSLKLHLWTRSTPAATVVYSAL